MKLWLHITVFFYLLFASTPALAEALSIKTEQDTYVFDVEIADSLEEQQKGLMFRESLPEDHGMLFYYAQNLRPGFWMKNTLIPLDMLFIDENGIIQHIHNSAQPNDLTPIISPNIVRSVLEINAGLSESLGIKTGDQVTNSTLGHQTDDNNGLR